MSDTIVSVQEEPRGPSQLVEVQVTANAQTRIQFPDQQQLRTIPGQIIIIKGIRFITPETLANGPISGLAACPLAEAQKITIVLYAEGWEKGQYIPLLILNDVATPGGTFPHRYHAQKFACWRNVDWSKSYLQYNNGSASANSPYVVMFDVEYERIDSFGNPIPGPTP